MDDTEKFMVGEIVTLNSGGPDMTIGELQGNYALCSWWNISKTAYDMGSFPLAALRKQKHLGKEAKIARQASGLD